MDAKLSKKGIGRHIWIIISFLVVLFLIAIILLIVMNTKEMTFTKLDVITQKVRDIISGLG